jgi:hypothetical protein
MPRRFKTYEEANVKRIVVEAQQKGKAQLEQDGEEWLLWEPWEVDPQTIENALKRARSAAEAERKKKRASGPAAGGDEEPDLEVAVPDEPDAAFPDDDDDDVDDVEEE